MSVIYATATKTVRMTATRDDVCGGTSGTLEIGTTGMVAVLATFTLTTAGGTVATDTWTIAFNANTVSAGDTGIAAAAQFKNNGGTALITGLTVGTAATDIILDSDNITSGQDITLTAATLQHAT